MQIGMFGVPGTGAAIMTTARNIFWGGDESRIKIMRFDAQIDSAAVDAANTPTTVLRAGLLLSQITSTSKLTAWNPDATDGTQELYGVNEHEQKMTDLQGTAVDRFAPVVISAPLKPSMLLIEGAAMVGHEAEYLARRVLGMRGVIMEDDPCNWKSGITPRNAVKSADYTIVAGDNGTTFNAITADVNFTLPAIKPGLSFEFLRADDFNLTVTSAEGDNIIINNDASADSIAFSTAANKIGARLRVTAKYVNGTKKWVPEVIPVTGTFLTTTTAT